MFKPHPLRVAIVLACAGNPALAAEQMLEEVQVTAAAEASVANGYQPLVSRSSTKSDTPLRDTPQSISVVTSKQLKDQAVQSLAEAVRYTPGVTFAQGEGNRDAAVIRGSLSTGDFFLDGVRDDVQYYRDIYNIDRVEILKGANGLAFGRGGAGGVINRISKEAGWLPVREVTVSAGSFDHKRAALDVGGGLTPELAGRVNIVTEDSGSYRDGVSIRRNGISPTVTFQPSDRTKVVLSAEYFNDLRVADRGIPSQNGKPFRTDPSTFFGNAAQSPTETTVRALGASIEHQLDNGVLLSNKTRYADYDKYYQNVYASSAVNPGTGTFSAAGYIDDTQRQNFFNQTDAAFTVNTGTVAHKLVTGVEIGRQDTASFRNDARFTAATTCTSAETTQTGVPAASPTAIATGFDCFNRRNHSIVDVASVYLQDTLLFSPKWQAILGVRHDRFATDFNTFNAAGNVSSRLNDVASELAPRAALIFKPVEAVTTYLSYSKTFVPRAGDQLGSLALNTGFQKPEGFQNREAGFKWDVSDRLAVNGAIYRLERSNVAIRDTANPNTNSLIVDGQLVKGAELSVAGRLTRAWSMVGGYAFTDSSYPATVTNPANGNTVAAAGNTVAQTPRHTFSLWNRYDLNDTWGAGIGFISRSSMFALDDNTVKLPGYGRVDAAVFYNASKQLKVQLNVENLLNRDYVVNAHTNNNITPGSPIAARVSATYRF